MKSLRVTATLGLLAFVLAGCDYGFVATHKATVTSALLGTAAPPPQSIDTKFAQLIRQKLSGEGFDENPGTRHIWAKRGATVELNRDRAGELILEVSAFGGKHDVRVAEKTDEELVAYLKQQPGVELEPLVRFTSLRK